MKHKLDDLAKELVNPFKHIRNWIKGEVMSLESLMDAIAEKEACDARKANSIKRLAEDRETVAKLGQGKFTIKTMFKSKSGKKRKQQSILEKIA